MRNLFYQDITGPETKPKRIKKAASTGRIGQMHYGQITCLFAGKKGALLRQSCYYFGQNTADARSTPWFYITTICVVQLAGLSVQHCFRKY